ncbi:MAG: transport-associated protein [Chloroflexi bacterium]|nr:transport-associated protein [Chloroflexota bacterium]
MPPSQLGHSEGGLPESQNSIWNQHSLEVSVVGTRLGIFLAGMLAAYLLDPVNGRKRRATVQSRLEPISQRLSSAKDQMADMNSNDQAAGDRPRGIMQTMQNIASSVQGRMADTVGRGAGPDGRQAESGLENQQASQPQQTAASQRVPEDLPGIDAHISAADVAPRPIPDPIAEGDPNDPTLVARVESELFRDDTLPKGSINIDAAFGVVTLRGTVRDGMAEELVDRTRAIEGVHDVVDRLHKV